MKSRSCIHKYHLRSFAKKKVKFGDVKIYYIEMYDRKNFVQQYSKIERIIIKSTIDRQIPIENTKEFLRV